MPDLGSVNEKLKKLYRLIEAEGGYAKDQFDEGLNEGICRALQHMEAAGFGNGISPLDLEVQSAA